MILPKRDQSREAREILRRLNDLTHIPLRYIVGQSHSTINLQQIMDEGKILLVRLDRRKKNATSLIGSIIVALILQATDTRTTKKQFHLYADEFQRFATEDFATLLEEARKASIGITMAHQNRGQLELSDKQADANLKQRTLSVDNLIVFRVPTDADELARQFPQKPPDPVPEWIEEADGMEKDIEEIAQDPVDLLVGARGTHGSATVRKITQVLLAPLVEAAEGRTGEAATFDSRNPPRTRELFISPYNKRNITYNYSYYYPYEAQDGKTLINRLLVDVMEERVALKYPFSELTERIQKIMVTLAGYIGWFGVYERFGRYFPAIWDMPHKPDAALLASLSTLIQDIVNDNNAARSYTLFCENVKRQVSQVYKPEQGTYEYQRIEYPNSISKWVEQAGRCARDFISNLVVLCKELAKEEGKIKLPTGQKQLVLKKHLHVPPRRTEQDMIAEVSRQLKKLPLFTARVMVTTQHGLEEHTIRTLKPEEGLYGTALQERIARIQKHNRAPSGRGIRACRPREEIEEEIRARQGRYSDPAQEPTDEEPPEDEQPVTRRPRN